MAFQAKVSSKREVKVMQTVKEKIEKKDEKKRVFSDETLKVLAMNLNDWGAEKQEPYLKENFTHVSPSLLEKYGYFNKDGSLRLYYFIDLLNQAQEIVEGQEKHLGSTQAYFLDEIDLPDNKRGIILLVQNNDGKMSIKLPTDR